MIRKTRLLRKTSKGRLVPIEKDLVHVVQTNEYTETRSSVVLLTKAEMEAIHRKDGNAHANLYSCVEGYLVVVYGTHNIQTIEDLRDGKFD